MLHLNAEIGKFELTPDRDDFLFNVISLEITRRCNDDDAEERVLCSALKFNILLSHHLYIWSFTSITFERILLFIKSCGLC